jgi:hypothetical protein
VGVGAAAGGCIYLRNGTLKIEDSVIQECYAEGLANPTGNGAGALGGAIYAIAGTLEIRNSSLVLNNAYGGASNAAGFVGGRAEGGAIYATGLRHYVATAHSYPINDLRAVMWRLVVPRAGQPRGSGNFLVGTCPLGLARTAEPLISH